MKITVYIDGKAYHATEAYPGAEHVTAENAPACECGARTFYGGPVVENYDTIEADAYCASCKAKRGRIVVKVDTLFGIEEDRAVGQRCRVY